MNASYNDQEKQASPVSSTCWDFAPLSKASLKSGGLILEVASSLLTGRNVFSTEFVCLFQHMKHQIFVVNSTFTNPVHRASTK